MLSAGFESTIPVIERPQTGALDCRTIGIGQYLYEIFINKSTNICQLIVYNAITIQSNSSLQCVTSFKDLLEIVLYSDCLKLQILPRQSYYNITLY